jgi:3-oxoacyl-(acyl-carrier-protein) synthase
LDRERIVVTGMAVNTPLGDGLDGFLEGLLAGRSALSRWKRLDTSRIYAKIGADLSAYDTAGKVTSLEGQVPSEVHRRLRRLVGRTPWSTGLSMLLAVDAFRAAKLFESGLEPTRVAVIVAGHNLNVNYQYETRVQFEEEPDFIDPMYALHGLDTDHAGCVSELLQVKGPIYTVGGACASANVALRAAVDELRHHEVEATLVVGAVLDFSPVDLHAMALMGAISVESFNDAPERASRPFDRRREGFVPAHGGGALVLERLSSAMRRGAPVYAEILGVEANADANHLPQPSEDGQSRLMSDLLRRCEIQPSQVDYISAHATSTPLGDLTEVRSIKRAFGEHAYRLKLNATKSMLGHTCWAAPVVETIAAILQMNAGRLHPSTNIDELDADVDLDVCAGRAVDHEVQILMKNSFGFGGINCISLIKRFAP